MVGKIIWGPIDMKGMPHLQIMAPLHSGLVFESVFSLLLQGTCLLIRLSFLGQDPCLTHTFPLSIQN